MTQGFVWFHNSNDNPSDSSQFYERLFGWTASAGPGGLTMLAGSGGPFAGVAQKGAGAAGWIPFAQVDDVDAATKTAVALGATMVNAKTRGPAGEYSIVRDPAGRPSPFGRRREMVSRDPIGGRAHTRVSVEPPGDVDQDDQDHVRAIDLSDGSGSVARAPTARARRTPRAPVGVVGLEESCTRWRGSIASRRRKRSTVRRGAHARPTGPTSKRRNGSSAST